MRWGNPKVSFVFVSCKARSSGVEIREIGPLARLNRIRIVLRSGPTFYLLYTVISVIRAVPLGLRD